MYSNYALKSIRLWLLAAVCLIVIYSCKKEIATIFNDQKPVPAEMQWAQDYYVQQLEPKEDEIFKPVTVMSADGQRGTPKKQNKLNMRWDKATAANSTLYSYVETPMAYEHKITTTLKIATNPSATPVPDLEVIAAAFDRLIIYKNKKGVINQRIVSYVPDAAYAKRYNGNITHNRIGKLDKDFFGFLQYKTWEGKILFVLRIENGKSVKRYGFEKSVTQPISSFHTTTDATVTTPKTTMVYDGGGGGSVPPECTYVISWDWYQDCYYYAGEEDPYMCDPIVVYNVQTAPAECPSDTGGGTGGGQGPIIDCTDPSNFDSGYCDIDDDTDIKLDSLMKYYPCMALYILNKLAQNQAYAELKAPFVNNNTAMLHMPTLTYGIANMSWTPQNISTALTTTNGTTWDAKIDFNPSALENASELFLAGAAVHELGHAYVNYYLKAGVYGYTQPSASWSLTIANYGEAFAQRTGFYNVTDHSIFLENYFESMLSVLRDFGGNKYSEKQYAMTVLFGLNYVGDPPIPGDYMTLTEYNRLKSLVQKSFERIKNKYGINQSTLDQFIDDNTINTPAINKLRKDCLD